MCRFVAYAGERLSPATAVFGGSHSLVHQSYAPQELLSGTVNADGYAVAWHPDGIDDPRPVRLAGAEPIWQNGDLEGLLASVRSPILMAGVRNATPGILPESSGVAPLVQGPWSFGLNGFLENFRARLMRPLHAGVPDAIHGRLRGTSDTEALFLLAQTALERGASLEDAAADSVQYARRTADELDLEAQLNLFLTAPDRIVVTRASNRAESNSLYVSERGPLAPQGCLVASEPLDDRDAWRSVPNGSLLTATRHEPAEIKAL